MAQTNRLRPIGEDETVPDLIAPPQPQPQRPPQPPREIAALTSMLMVALRALSQRFVVALATLQDLGLAASVFVLWWKVIEAPSVLQLTGLGMYAMFVLMCLYLRRKM